MRLFLDASMSPAVAAELMQLGLDVVAQREVLKVDSSDLEVMHAAWADQRIIVARDYDMAELVLRGFTQAVAVVVVAFDATNPADEAKRIAHDLD
jgi:predicted nuclease of predicted toxin-antitoxin system